jgi:IclR family acetate operon transcriptional repressor
LFGCAEHESMTQPRRYAVQSVDRALALLELLAAAGGKGLGVSAVARELGISKSTAFALLQTLAARDFVDDEAPEGGRRYRLGPALARLGDRMTAGLSFTEVARPVMHALTKTTLLTSRLAVLDAGFAVAVARVDAPGMPRQASYLGRREHAHCSAIGKALLSTLPPEQARQVIDRVGLPRRTEHTITDPADLMKELAFVAARGYALDNEEDVRGVFCVGAAILDRSGGSTGAISVSGLKHGLPEARLHELGAIVREHADRIAERLGGPSHAAWRAHAPSPEVKSRAERRPRAATR